MADPAHDLAELSTAEFERGGCRVGPRLPEHGRGRQHCQLHCFIQEHCLLLQQELPLLKLNFKHTIELKIMCKDNKNWFRLINLILLANCRSVIILCFHS